MIEPSVFRMLNFGSLSKDDYQFLRKFVTKYTGMTKRRSLKVAI